MERTGTVSGTETCHLKLYRVPAGVTKYLFIFKEDAFGVYQQQQDGSLLPVVQLFGKGLSRVRSITLIDEQTTIASYIEAVTLAPEHLTITPTMPLECTGDAKDEADTASPDVTVLQPMNPLDAPKPVAVEAPVAVPMDTLEASSSSASVDLPTDLTWLWIVIGILGGILLLVIAFFLVRHYTAPHPM